MAKKTDLLFIGLVLAAMTATYVVKYGSEIESNKIAKLEREINVEKEAIDILNANWSLLTSPHRMQTLAKRHSEELQLEILQPKQIIKIEDIPLRPIDIPTEQNATNQPKSDRINDIITGSIKSGSNQ